MSFIKILKSIKARIDKYDILFDTSLQFDEHPMIFETATFPFNCDAIQSTLKYFVNQYLSNALRMSRYIMSTEIYPTIC